MEAHDLDPATINPLDLNRESVQRMSMIRKCMWVCPTCAAKNVSAYDEKEPISLRCGCGLVILGDGRPTLRLKSAAAGGKG